MEKYICRRIINELKENGTIFSIKSGYLFSVPYDYDKRIPECVELLSRWRIENPSLSPQRFPVSNERTKKWIEKSILNNEFRVMFMIQNQSGKCIGHIGLSHINFEDSIVRIDSVMRGVKDDSPGIIGEAIDFLKNWCRNTLNAEYVDLLVLDDNAKAISLYKKCGFINNIVIPLRCVEENGEQIWVEDFRLIYPEKKYINMICKL